MTRRLLLIAALLAITAAPLSADPVLNFSSNTGASIVFASGGTFSFPTLSDFTIGTVSGSPLLNAFVGMTGDITGVFTIGEVTTVGPMQSAPVTGSGTVVIGDGVGGLFTMSFVPVNLMGLGAIGGINYTAAVNMAFVSYTGTVADFQEFAHSAAFIGATSIQFVQNETLTSLMDHGGATSFSGSIAGIPEPGSLLLLGGGLIGLAVIVRRSSTKQIQG